MATPNSTVNQAPLFTFTPVISSNNITVSNPSKSNINGQTGVFTTVASGNNFGTRIDYLRISNTGTNTAAVVRLFIDNSKTVPNFYSNTGIYLFQEVVTSAVTASATVAGYTNEVTRVDSRPIMTLPSGVLLVATASAQDPNGMYVIQAYGGDY